MTVAELIAKLQELPQDLPVVVEGSYSFFEVESVRETTNHYLDVHSKYQRVRPVVEIT